MRKLGTILATLGLTALGLAVPVTSAQAATADGNLCASKWPGRDGNVRAWEHWGCNGELLGVTGGSDTNWSDALGDFQYGDAYKASSVMNSGFAGAGIKDVVAFYFNWDYKWQDGYVCLAPGEKWADNLTDNNFTAGQGVVNDRIGSHTWVYSTGCAADSWLT
ncbi:hypothetical protein [Streptomyces sp. NPDC020681]|uniref:hypothetical protein n=1 Tax=Streptomyces sp. NPDC020681 TaxID=3365083 RepID=UPI00379C9304